MLAARRPEPAQTLPFLILFINFDRRPKLEQCFHWQSLNRGPTFEKFGADAARRLRAAITTRECYYTNEIVLGPSITFQPVQLLNTFIRARLCVAPTDLTPDPVTPK